MKSRPVILAGDVGGTKITLALFEKVAGDVLLLDRRSFASREQRSLAPLIRDYLQANQARPGAACIGVAGPVINGRCDLTNLGMVIHEVELAEATGIPGLRLVNDLAATGAGALHLPASDWAVVNEGDGSRGPGTIAVLAAGTGLGEAILHWDGARHRPIAGEGSHADFAPRTEIEIDLLGAMRQEFGHVSYDRIVSGSGLYWLYRFMRVRSGLAEPVWLRGQIASAEDPSPFISDAAIAGRDSVCVEALDLYCSIFGAEAGNLALKCLAVGGVYLGGGIAPKIHPALRSGAFMKAFVAKGRFESFLAATPVRVIMNPDAALWGAAWYAAGD